MNRVRRLRSIPLLVFAPFCAGKVRQVEITRRVAPPLVEDLFEFFFRVEIRAQCEIQTPLARLWRSSIRIDNEKRWSRRPPSESGWTTTGSTARGRTIDQLAAVSTEIVVRNANGQGSHA